MTIPQKSEKLWNLVEEYRSMDKQSIIRSIANHLEFSLCKNRYTVEKFDIYEALALTVRDYLIEFWNDTQQTYYDEDAKKVYYLSLEFLMGRGLRNNLINLGMYDVCKEAIEEIGYELDELEEMEHDAGLGNGGLGRLAACFLDSLATLQLPADGYGIRYEYGIFEQRIENNEQVEHPDKWLWEGHPWEIPRFDYLVPIQFYGHVENYTDEKGDLRYRWKGSQEVLAMAYDVPISAYGSHTVNNLRLWTSMSSKDFDFHLFNAGDYIRAVEEKQRSETISKVLYPNDAGFSGKELRLKQQYFFVSASLQDIIRRYQHNHESFEKFPEKVGIQLNDTHPSIAIPELMRIFMDDYGMNWDKAWGIATKVFGYTNHTVLPEALEKWPVEMLGHLLPRHLEIIYEINHRFLEYVKAEHPDDEDLPRRVSIIEEGGNRQIRMPYLAIVGSHAVNGVAALHTELLKKTIFKDFYHLFPERFQNKTNGITPRRWLRSSNPKLSELISSKIGDIWVNNLGELKKLTAYADDAKFQKAWSTIKKANKQKLADYIKKKNGIEVNVNAIFDIQVKRIHEYKRQLLNILYLVAMYNRIRKNPNKKVVPRVSIFGGKAAPGYYMAKSIIHLANDIGTVINNDPVVGDKLKVIFLENFSVSLGEKVYPAAELSEQISTAGMEASGTGNMKFMLNGAITIGTMDGANVEIHEEVGDDNIFIFGMTDTEVFELREAGYNPMTYYESNKELREVLDMIKTGAFNSENPNLYEDIVNNLLYNDHYMLLADFESYVACQDRASQAYLDQKKWTRMSILNTANAGKFSSDRTILEYADEIWDLKPVEIKLKDHKTR